MTILNKSNKLDNVCYDIRGSVLEAANAIESAGDKILKLNIGNPASFGLMAEPHVTQSLVDHLINVQGYSESKGIRVAREAVFNSCQETHFQNINIDHIFLGNGVSEFIMMSLQSLLNNGDEILIPMPDYPLWTAATNLSGGKAVHYRCNEEDQWNPCLDDIKTKISSKTKGLVIINPNNPTGSVYTKETLLGIAEIAREHNLIIFADEIYDKITYDNIKHIPFASLQDDILVLTMNGLSKTYRLAGCRAAWMVISGKKHHAKDYIQGINMLASMRLCSNVPSQYLIAEALNNDQSIYQMTLPKGLLGRQREITYKMLNNIEGVSCIKPKGAIYCFAKLDQNKFNIQDDEKMMLDLVIQKHILLVQGTAFNWDKPDHFRIVFLPQENQMIDAINRLEDFLNHYHQ